MNDKKIISQQTGLICALSLFFGIILLMVSYFLKPGIYSYLARELGIVCTSVCIVSFLYEKFLAEKHFDEFRKLITNILNGQATIQSVCTKLGITEIFANRNEYQQKFPIENLFGKVRKGGRILVVGRTMCHLFSKTKAIQTALKNGAVLEIAMIGSPNNDKILCTITGFGIDQVVTPLKDAEEIVGWLLDEKPPGILEIRTYAQPLPDSLIFIEMEDSTLVVWDLSFGNDDANRMTFLMNTFSSNLGMKLYERYGKIWKYSTPIFQMNQDRTVVLNRIALLRQHICGAMILPDNGELQAIPEPKQVN